LVELLYTKANFDGFGENLLPKERAMAKRSSPGPDSLAQPLVEDIHAQADEIVREVAQMLDAVPDQQLFGETEFLVRQKVLKIVAAAYTARVGQKKTARSGRASTARTAAKPPNSTATGSVNP
jgi:hypothetical protein